MDLYTVACEIKETLDQDSIRESNNLVAVLMALDIATGGRLPNNMNTDPSGLRKYQKEMFPMDNEERFRINVRAAFYEYLRLISLEPHNRFEVFLELSNKMAKFSVFDYELRCGIIWVANAQKGTQDILDPDTEGS